LAEAIAIYNEGGETEEEGQGDSKVEGEGEDKEGEDKEGEDKEGEGEDKDNSKEDN